MNKVILVILTSVSFLWETVSQCLPHIRDLLHRSLLLECRSGSHAKVSNSHQIFTFWHQVLQNKTFRFRTKKYLDFAPNHFLLYRSGTKMVTFPHQKCYVLVTLSHHNSLHGAKTLLFTSKIGRIQYNAIQSNLVWKRYNINSIWNNFVWLILGAKSLQYKVIWCENDT